MSWEHSKEIQRVSLSEQQTKNIFTIETGA